MTQGLVSHVCFRAILPFRATASGRSKLVQGAGSAVSAAPGFAPVAAGLTVMLGMFGARALLRLFADKAAPARQQQHRPTGSGSAQILTDVDYVVLDDEKR